MLATREEELNMVNSGMSLEGVFGGSKFNVGEKVISKSSPDLGIGVVLSKVYEDGWWYNVVMGGEILIKPECDLEYPLL